MSAAASAPWSSILSDVSASLNGMTSLSSADILQLRQPRADESSELHSSGPGDADSGSSPAFSISGRDPLPTRSDGLEKRLPNVADWKGTLDLVTGMTGAAGDQRNRLREQTEAQQRALEFLQSELNETRHRLQASEQRALELRVQADSRLQRIQADLDAQVEETRAEAETRVRAICARNTGRIRATEERVRAAELRAQTAEQWLHRIDAAAKNLLLNGSKIC